jgi:hypothetical protein
MYAPLRKHAYVADRCHVTRATPHHRTLSALENNVVMIHVTYGNGSPLFLLSAQVEGKPLIGNCLPHVRGADSTGGRAYR